MSDDAIAILLMLYMATVAYAVYLRVFVVRRLRKKLDKLVDAALAVRPASLDVRSAPAVDELSEFKRMQDRLKVLERIAVEKENTLSREIEELRAAGR